MWITLGELLDTSLLLLIKRIDTLLNMSEHSGEGGFQREFSSNQSEGKKVKSIPRRLVSRPHRAGRFAASLAAIGAVAAGSVPPLETSVKEPPQVEHAAPSWSSVTETFTELQHDPQVDKSDKIDFAPLRKGLSENDYKSERYKEALSADLLEVRYNKHTDQLQFLQQSKGLDKNAQYDLLTPVFENQMMLKTAFAVGDLDRVAMRALYPDSSATFEDTYAGYSTDNPTHMKEVTFLFSGGNISMRNSELTSDMNHEVIHALTDKYSLSQEGEKPKQEDITTWQNVCRDIRTIAIDEAETKKGTILKTMEDSVGKFTDPKARAAFEQVYADLKNANLNKDQEYGVKKGELSDCQTVGPTDAFWNVLYKDPKYLGNLGTEEQEALGKMSHEWYDLIKDETIYKELREAAYGESEHSGHPFDNWEELVASVGNITMLHPEKLADNIKKLPEDKQKVATSLVNISVDTLAAQVPQEAKFEPFHQRLADARKKFDGKLHG